MVLEREQLLEALAWLRDEPTLELGFLSSVTATHWPGRATRRSGWPTSCARCRCSHRLRVKVGLREGDATVPSVTPLFPTANWHERETFDFYGIDFAGHPDLTRILLPADWEGHPLRKDEPLGGVPTWFHGATMPPIDERGMA